MKDKLNRAWKNFEKTGNVKHYLEYKGISYDFPELKFDVEAGIFDDFDLLQDIESENTKNQKSQEERELSKNDTDV